MRSIIIVLLVLAVSVAAWMAVLWFLALPLFASWPMPANVALHALPPLLLWILWMALSQRARRAEAAQARAYEDAERASRAEAESAARQAHEDEMHQRRLGCDCRAMSMVGLAMQSSLPLLKAEVPGVTIQLAEPEDDTERLGQSVLERLAPAMTEALLHVYSACTAAIGFPIFVQPPAEVSGDEALQCIRSIHAKLLRALGTVAETPSILFLPSSDSVQNSMISLFETSQDLPAAIVLAFDSPWSRLPVASPFDDEPGEEQLRRQQRFGKPGECAIALLLTNSELPSLLVAVPDIDSQTGTHDGMTPFWQKETAHPGIHPSLSRTSLAEREQLAGLSVLGRIHRAAFSQPDHQQPGVLEMTRRIRLMLETAQINAGLIDKPFAPDGAAPETSPDGGKTSKQCTPGRLIHNAGNTSNAGKRLAALGTALHHFDIDLNPVDAETVTNMVTDIGDLGRASGLAQLALATAHAAQRGEPVLLAEFSEEQEIALSFVMPVRAAS